MSPSDTHSLATPILWAARLLLAGEEGACFVPADALAVRQHLARYALTAADLRDLHRILTRYGAELAAAGIGEDLVPPPESTPAVVIGKAPHASAETVTMPFGKFAGRTLAAMVREDPGCTGARGFLAYLARESKYEHWRRTAAAALRGEPVAKSARDLEAEQAAAQAAGQVAGQGLPPVAPGKPQWDARTGYGADTAHRTGGPRTIAERARVEVWILEPDAGAPSAESAPAGGPAYPRLGVRIPSTAIRLEGAIREIEGRRWNGARKRWEVPVAMVRDVVRACAAWTGLTPDEAIATGRLRLDAATRSRYDAELARRARLDEIRGRTESDLQVATRLPLDGYQRVGVEFWLASERRALNNDDMGVGKTMQGIGCAEYAQAERRGSGRADYRTLVAAPAGAVPTWFREILRFTGVKACEWTAQGPRSTLDLRSRYHLVSLTSFPEVRAQLEAQGFDFFVVDECHNLANPKTVFAKAILGHAGKGGGVATPPFATPDALFLTGTTVLTGALDLFSLAHYLAPARFPDARAFRQQYKGADPGSPELLRLRDRMQDITLRRRESDVLALPPLTQGEVVVSLNEAEQAEYRALLKKVFGAWTLAGRPSAIQAAQLQIFLSRVKLRHVRTWVDAHRATGRSVLVFSVYTEPLKALVQHYGRRAVLITGEQTPTTRARMVDRIQGRQADVGCVALKAGGVNLTITAATRELFLNQWWVPALHRQALKRAHRRGQTEAVHVDWLVAEGTIDVLLREVLQERLAVAATIEDGSAEAVALEKSVFADFFNRLKREFPRELAGLRAPDDDNAATLMQILATTPEPAIAAHEIGAGEVVDGTGEAVRDRVVDEVPQLAIAAGAGASGGAGEPGALFDLFGDPVEDSAEESSGTPLRAVAV